MSDPTGTPTVIVRRGDTVREIAPDQLADFQREGWAPETANEHAERVVTNAQSENEGTGSALIAGGLRGATFGGSDVILRAIGGEDSALQLRHMQENHGTASLGGELLGGLAAGGVAGRIGSAVEGLTDSRLLASAAEGAAYGTGSGISQLALSDDPLTAEHVFSTLGTNALTGAGIGTGFGVAGKIAGRAMDRASALLNEAGAARSAIEGIPAELQGLDEAGLKAAAQSEREALKAAASEERASLEQLRASQREEMAAQVKDLHDSLAEESPIFHSVQGDDVAAIDGVKDIKVQLAKSFQTMRAQFDDPIGIAKKPELLVRPLRMRQAALEQLQEKVPALQTVLGQDARAAALDSVGDALEQTKQQIAKIEEISGSTQKPLASGRLAQLESGTSPKLEAIEAAREALKKAPEMGLLQKGATSAAFAGGTALAHMIPGVGIAAPFLGKAASDMVSKAFGHLASGVKAAEGRSQAALKSFLSIGERARTPAVATAATVLNEARFSPSVKEGEGAASLLDAYKARADELRSQTTYAPDGSTVMRPEARMALAKRLAPIAAVNPLLADKVETTAARAVTYLSAALPKHPEVGGMQVGPDKWHPSELEMRAFARKVRAVQDPHSVEERLAAGVVTPEEAEAYRTVYPEKFAAMQQQIATAAPQLSRTLPVKKKVALYVFTGVPTMPALQPNVFKQLQSNFTSEPGSANGQAAPKPAPNFGALGSLKDLDKPTRAQRTD